MERKYTNVNHAFYDLVSGISTGAIPTTAKPSRYGDVLMIEEPCTITYLNPLQRVLLSTERDCNPFFHVFEALWMLAGRNDVAPLKYYASRMGKFSDNGKTHNGAYGYRWRQANGHLVEFDMGMGRGSEWQTVDQLKIIIDQLKDKPESRRVVLQMWNVEDDLLKIDTSKDVCCNVCAFFSIRDPDDGLTCGPFHPDVTAGTRKHGDRMRPLELDMTVVNRSNDMIWGMLGANVVHFSFLQEYVANCVGVGTGAYHQFTNNLHVYKERWNPEQLLSNTDEQETYMTFYPSKGFIPLVKDPATFDQEVKQFVGINGDGNEIVGNLTWQEGNLTWQEPFLQRVAQPMCHAFHRHKARDYDAALHWVEKVEPGDWRTAARNWINKRMEMWSKKKDVVE